MTSVINIREAVIAAYRSPAWTAKVKRMPDAQVIAIFNRLKEQNVIRSA